ncbi:MAG: 5,10-methylenetetrahydromethanopterin reductase [Halobacteriales archaeon]
MDEKASNRDGIVQGVELTPEEPLDEVAALAERAEAAGFDAILSSCHYFNRDPFVALRRMVDATEEVRVGPGVVNPYDAHPVALASRAATLQEESGGRALFGIGAGDASTLSALGIERDRPLRRVLESFKMAQELWEGGSVDRDGAVTARGATLNYAVDPLPVYVGAQGPDMLRMAAKHADGVLYNASHPRDVGWATDRVAEGLSQRPSDRGSFDFVVQASVSVAGEAEAARETARQAAAVIAGGAAPPVLDRHGIDVDLASEIGELVSAGKFRPAFAKVSEPMIDAFCVAGTPADVAGRIDAIREDADGVVAATPLGPDRATAIDLLADATAP